MRQKIFFFVFFALLNVGLKSPYLGETSFNYDEIISVKNTLLDFGHIKHEAEWDNNPPFFYYCFWVWHRFLPVSEFNSRLLSVIFVSLGIGFTFLFSAQYFGKRVAIWSCILLSLSNFLTYHAQECRAYSLVFLLSVLSSIIFFKFYYKPGWIQLFLLSFLNFLILYTHYIAVLVIVVQYFFIIFSKIHQKRNFLIVQSLLIVILVFVRFTPKQFYHIFHFNSEGDFWLKTTSLGGLWSGLQDMFGAPLQIAMLLLVLIYGVFELFTRDSDVRPLNLYLLGVGAGSIVVLFVIGLFKSVFLPRYLIFCLPFVLIFFSFYLVNIKFGNIILAIYVVIAVFIVEIAKPEISNYRDLAQVIRQNKRIRDYVIINTRDNLPLFMYYFDKNTFFRYKNLDSVARSRNIYSINQQSELNLISFSNSDNVFLIQSFHKIHGQQNLIREFLNKRMPTIFQTHYYSGIEFSLYSNR